MKFTGSQRVHFIGIGGAGMSAIAKVLLERGLLVSGSDLKSSPATRILQAMGASVHVGHDAGLLAGGETVIVSSAIPDRNPELVRARELGLKVMSRGEALAAVLSESRAIVVAGTHGKTTTTSMIVTVLRAAGLDPTYLVGGGLNDAGTNARFGRGDLSVAESDESDGSFLLLAPHVGVITNVEVDHVDYWDSLAAIRDAFAAFMRGVDEDGVVVVPASDPDVCALAQQSGRRVISFDEGGMVTAPDLELDATESRFTLSAEGGEAPVRLRVPGRHNISNALAAAAACLPAGISIPQIAAGLDSYLGVERRFQLRGQAAGITVIDDYAHHPTEIRATLGAARPGPWRKIVAVFQPHRYSRTAAMARDFGTSFVDADRVVVTDVYGAGETAVPGVTGKLVADAVCTSLPGRPVAYLPHRAELLDYLSSSARSGDVIVTLGAGDVTSVGQELLARLQDRPDAPTGGTA